MEQATFEAICADIAAGEPAYKAAQAHGIAHSTFWTWIAADSTLADKYARAKLQGLERMADEIIAISDDCSGDDETRVASDGSEYKAMNSEYVQRSRLRVDSRKWLLSKLAPKKYGDKLELGSDPNSPLVVKLLPKDEAA